MVQSMGTPLSALSYGLQSLFFRLISTPVPLMFPLTVCPHCLLAACAMRGCAGRGAAGSVFFGLWLYIYLYLYPNTSIGITGPGVVMHTKKLKLRLQERERLRFPPAHGIAQGDGWWMDPAIIPVYAVSSTTPEIRGRPISAVSSHLWTAIESLKNYAFGREYIQLQNIVDDFGRSPLTPITTPSQNWVDRQ